MTSSLARNWSDQTRLCAVDNSRHSCSSISFNPTNWRQLCTTSGDTLTVWNIGQLDKTYSLMARLGEMFQQIQEVASKRSSPAKLTVCSEILKWFLKVPASQKVVCPKTKQPLGPRHSCLFHCKNYPNQIGAYNYIFVLICISMYILLNTAILI